MRIFAIHIKEVEQAIVIFSRTITINDKPNGSWVSAPKWDANLTKTIAEHMKADFAYDNPDLVDKSVKRLTITVPSDGHLEMNNQKHYIQTSLVRYTLPTNYSLALDLLSAYFSFFKSRQFDNIILVDRRNGERFIDQELQFATFDSIMQLGKAIKSTSVAMQELSRTLLEVPGASRDYRPILSTIASMLLNHQKHSDVNFGENFRMEKRYTLEENGKIKSLIDAVTPTERVNYLYKLVRHLLDQNKKDELNHFLDSISKSAIVRLYESCLGLEAHDGGNYHWKYTEWPVLEHAKFYIRADQRMGIKLKDNQGYNDRYAPGRPNHDVMQAEFVMLFKYLGLEFDEDTNFHDELIFTPASTEKLIQTNVHINREYVQKLLKAKVDFGLFRQFQKQIPSLYRDVFQIIGFFKRENELTNLLSNDLQTTITIGWETQYASIKT